MIVLDRLTKHFGATTAVDQLSLTVPTGSICALVGPPAAASRRRCA